MRRILIAAIVLLVVIGSLFLATRMPGLDVQVLDVSGYRDEIPVWMPFRVTLGLRNEGREPVVIERIFVEPDLDDFNEAFSGSTVLTPPLRIEPGASASYQAAVMLLNAQPATRAHVRVGVSRHRRMGGWRCRLRVSYGVRVRTRPDEPRTPGAILEVRSFT